MWTANYYLWTKKTGGNVPPKLLFSPGWPQDCRAPLWQKPAPPQHMAKAEDTKYVQEFCPCPVHECIGAWYWKTSECHKRQSTHCWFYKCMQLSPIKRQSASSVVLTYVFQAVFIIYFLNSWIFLTSAGPSCRSEVISTQRSYRSRSFLNSRASCRRCSWSFPKRSWYIAWLWVTPLGS